MSRARTITRRTLLAGSAAVAGGAAFGAWWIGREPPNPLAPGEGATALNAFVIVDGEGVTVVAPPRRGWDRAPTPRWPRWWPRRWTSTGTGYG